MAELRPAQEMAAALILAHFPHIAEELSVEDFIAESAVLREELFRKVDPMPGARELIKGLVSDGGV